MDNVKGFTSAKRARGEEVVRRIGEATAARGIDWSIPNQITILRLLMTPIFIGFLVYGMKVPALFVFCLSGISDALDGLIARRYHLTTELGALLDPLADKIFTVSGFVILVQYGHLPGWVAIVILTREFGVTGLRGMAAVKGEVIAAASIGKLKTLLQMLTLLLGGCIWVGWLSLDMQLPGINLGLETIWITVYWLVASVTVYSGIDYFIKGRNLYVKEL